MGVTHTNGVATTVHQVGVAYKNLFGGGLPVNLRNVTRTLNAFSVALVFSPSLCKVVGLAATHTGSLKRDFAMRRNSHPMHDYVFSQQYILLCCLVLGVGNCFTYSYLLKFSTVGFEHSTFRRIYKICVECFRWRLGPVARF